MVQSRRGVIWIMEVQVRPLRIWGTPRRDWTIGFKGGKGISSWINFGIATARRCICASRI
jgi:hypothetical protein